MDNIILLLFLLVVLSANIIQGITGFAGTILAMPFGIMLIGLQESRFILNILGILASIWIVSLYYKEIQWREFLKIVLGMGVGVFVGLWIYSIAPLDIVLKILPIFIIFIAIRGFWNHGKGKKNRLNRTYSVMLTLVAGIFHGMFVVGGPLIVIYASEKIDDKSQFRATLSLVWVVLNSMIFIDTFRTVEINSSLSILLVGAILCLGIGMFLGDILHKKMSHNFFMRLTYGMLCISGISILLR